MIVRALDVDGDWTFGKGRNNYLSNNAAIVQMISTRLNSYLGDCFFALDAGIDWFNLLGTKQRIALELAVRSVILNTEGVTRLVSSEIIYQETTRQLVMKYTVETVYTVVNNGVTPVLSGSAILLTEAGDAITTEDGSPLIAG